MSTDARSVAARLSSSGFIISQGLIGGKWTDAYDGKTIEVRSLRLLMITSWEKKKVFF